MPKYEFYVSVTYTKSIEIEADDLDKAHELACETKDSDIIDYGHHSFECVLNRELQDA